MKSPPCPRFFQPVGIRLMTPGPSGCGRESHRRQALAERGDQLGCADKSAGPAKGLCAYLRRSPTHEGPISARRVRRRVGGLPASLRSFGLMAPRRVGELFGLQCLDVATKPRGLLELIT